MYEPKQQKPVSRSVFARRMALHGGWVAALLAASLGVGMLGYRGFEQLNWTDAFLNAAMLLGGMGPVDLPKTEAGKLFAGCFALYAGLVFIVTAALLFTPLLHRLLHRFHWDEKA
jgi:hypothetical protein